MKERDQAMKERDQAMKECDQNQAERDQAMKECDQIQAQSEQERIKELELDAHARIKGSTVQTTTDLGVKAEDSLTVSTASSNSKKRKTTMPVNGIADERASKNKRTDQGKQKMRACSPPRPAPSPAASSVKDNASGTSCSKRKEYFKPTAPFIECTRELGLKKNEGKFDLWVKLGADGLLQYDITKGAASKMQRFAKCLPTILPEEQIIRDGLANPDTGIAGWRLSDDSAKAFKECEDIAWALVLEDNQDLDEKEAQKEKFSQWARGELLKKGVKPEARDFEAKMQATERAKLLNTAAKNLSEMGYEKSDRKNVIWQICTFKALVYNSRAFRLTTKGRLTGHEGRPMIRAYKLQY